MKDATAVYLGKIVSKNNFRVFVYSPEGAKKLVESWDAYESHMQTGLWFPTKDEALLSVAPVEVEAPKRTRKVKAKEDEPKGVLGALDIDGDESTKDDLAFEVKEKDDFLPKK